MLNYLHDSAATGIWELYQWQTDGELKLLSEAAIQFTDGANSGELIGDGRTLRKTASIKISYTSEPFAYEDEARLAFGIRQADGHCCLTAADPGEAAELGLRP